MEKCTISYDISKKLMLDGDFLKNILFWYKVFNYQNKEKIHCVILYILLKIWKKIFHGGLLNALLAFISFNNVLIVIIFYPGMMDKKMYLMPVICILIITLRQCTDNFSFGSCLNHFKHLAVVI